jgi:hypothetical protein
VKDLESMLRYAADRGDARAACRLGIELARCRRVESMQTELNDTQTALDETLAEAGRTPQHRANVTRLSHRIEELNRTLAENLRLCRGVSQESARDGWRYLFSAASAGNVAAMSRFVREPGFAPNDAEAAEAWESFLRSAPDFLTGAIEGGDVRALYQGWSSASSGRTVGDLQMQAFPRDPDKALQYGTAVANLVDRKRAALVAADNAAIAKEIGPERAALARREGERIRATFFANASPVEWSSEVGETNVDDCWK